MEWGSKDGGRLSPDGRVTLGFASVTQALQPPPNSPSASERRYDLIEAGPVSVHEAALQYARENNVSIITAHIVKGQQATRLR